LKKSVETVRGNAEELEKKMEDGKFFRGFFFLIYGVGCFT
jgi:hypothetical protein